MFADASSDKFKRFLSNFDVLIFNENDFDATNPVPLFISKPSPVDPNLNGLRIIIFNPAGGSKVVDENDPLLNSLTYPIGSSNHLQ